jgi:glycosyltransferase involved in cell wall biosynthesis
MLLAFNVMLTLSALALGLVVINHVGWPRIAPGRARHPGTVSILIPARNEERCIREALDSALQQGEAVREILVYDDHSTDGTAKVITETMKTSSLVRLVAAESLSEGWSGKSFACSRLSAAAQGEWLLFLDADARLLPGAVDGMLGEAHRRKATFLSSWPGLDLHGFWEKMLMPMLNFVVFTLFPAPLSLKMSLPSLGLAHGACLLMRREEYQRMGGHERVRNELFEDTALARAWRHAGLRGLCLDGQDVVRVRMYDSLAAIWNGFQKNIYPAFRREINFWLFCLMHFVLFTLPFLACLVPRTGGMAGPAGGAALCVLLMRSIHAMRFRYPPWSALLHPLSELAMLAVAMTSRFKYRAGAGIEWKGRRYRAGRRTA